MYQINNIYNINKRKHIQAMIIYKKKILNPQDRIKMYINNFVT